MNRILSLALVAMLVVAACSSGGSTSETVNPVDETTTAPEGLADVDDLEGGDVPADPVTVEELSEVLTGGGASEELADCYAEVLGDAGADITSLDDLSEVATALDADAQTELQRCVIDHAG